VHAVLGSLARHLPDLRLALLNGQVSAQEEAAVLECSNVPGAVPSLLGLLPAIQPLFRDLQPAIKYSPAAVSDLLSGAGHGGLCIQERDHAWASAQQTGASEIPSPVHIAVVTPGRLVHHLRRLGRQWLKHLRFLVWTCCPSMLESYLLMLRHGYVQSFNLLLVISNYQEQKSLTTQISGFS
jgi:hypothetical protein